MRFSSIAFYNCLAFEGKIIYRLDARVNLAFQLDDRTHAMLLQYRKYK